MQAAEEAAIGVVGLRASQTSWPAQERLAIPLAAADLVSPQQCRYHALTAAQLLALCIHKV
jgi:hypothetical protein